MASILAMHPLYLIYPTRAVTLDRKGKHRRDAWAASALSSLRTQCEYCNAEADIHDGV
jgi:hypothetical protein